MRGSEKILKRFFTEFIIIMSANLIIRDFRVCEISDANFSSCFEYAAGDFCIKINF